MKKLSLIAITTALVLGLAAPAFAADATAPVSAPSGEMTAPSAMDQAAPAAKKHHKKKHKKPAKTSSISGKKDGSFQVAAKHKKHHHKKNKA